MNHQPSRKSPAREDGILRMILEGTAHATGEEFFRELVRHVAQALGVHGSWVTEYIPGWERLRALAFWLGGEFIEDYEYDLKGTPCEGVFRDGCRVHISDRIIELFPGDLDLRTFSAVSYMGIPLKDSDGGILGHLSVLDTKPLPEEPRSVAVFEIFAARAAAEHRRLRAEADVRQREEKLARLVASAMDGIVELDSALTVLRTNPAADRLFGDHAVGQSLTAFLEPNEWKQLLSLIGTMAASATGHPFAWIPGGLRLHRPDGSVASTEATLSRFEWRRAHFFTLILRNISDRIASEQRIRALTTETQFLREKLRVLQESEEMIGGSASLRQVLDDVEQVAATDATVLILGESGTGKELVARAIHNRSPRAGKRLVRVNCAAVPAALIESEFFGHEKGAFTGATSKREGRFALADQGTIFLDEIGELPRELQPKLLRVLQEGEYEPVGSSETCRVNVRVIAATNRDLLQEVEAGRFREDLYYRLHVFPISMPPLRERKEDIPALACAFAERCAVRLNIAIQPLNEETLRRLQQYDWPGNVRQLQNVIERAVITAQDGQISLERALPQISNALAVDAAAPPAPEGNRVLTIAELRDVERQNIIRALDRCNGRIAGPNGAAALLGVKPSTLSSRVQALGIARKLRA